MSITYNSILEELNKKYHIYSKRDKDYYLNENGEIVASYDNNSISMYFDFPEESLEIMNHKGRVIATFAKDFQVNDIVADVIILEGLYGACNDSKIVDNFAYETFVNHELDDFYDSNKKQKVFESLPYEKRKEILEKLTGATFEETNIDRITLFMPQKMQFASCGEINSHNGIAQIKLSDNLIIDGIKVSKKSIGYDINVLNIKKINSDFDYRNVYDYWKQYKGWYYTTRRNNVSSQEIIEWTERRKNSTIDSAAIHYIGNPYSYITDPIYYDSKSLLNARRLQMQHILSQIAPKESIAELMSSYNFNTRENDIQKSR